MSAGIRRRARIYQRELETHGGVVPCFVCGESVSHRAATLEHIVPRSRGGGNAASNLAISHGRCNNSRGAPAVGPPPTPKTPKRRRERIKDRSAVVWPAQRGIRDEPGAEHSITQEPA